MRESKGATWTGILLPAGLEGSLRHSQPGRSWARKEEIPGQKGGRGKAGDRRRPPHLSPGRDG